MPVTLEGGQRVQQHARCIRGALKLADSHLMRAENLCDQVQFVTRPAITGPHPFQRLRRFRNLVQMGSKGPMLRAFRVPLDRVGQIAHPLISVV